MITFFPRLPYRIVVIIFIAFCILVLGFAAVLRTPPNLFIGERDISFKKQEEARLVINNEIGRFEKTAFTFSVGGEMIVRTASELGISYVGWSDAERSLIERTAVFMRGFWSPSRISPQYRIDTQKLDSFSEELSKYETLPVDSKIITEDGRLSVSAGKVGEVIDRTKMISDLKKNLEYLRNDGIVVEFVKKEPDFNENDAQKIAERLKVLENQKLVFSFEGSSWTLGGFQVADYLKFYPEGREDGYIFRLDGFFKDAVLLDVEYSKGKKREVQFSLEDKKIDEFLGTIASALDREKKNGDLRFENGKVVEFTPAVDGQKLDIARTKELVVERLSVDAPGDNQTISISLPVIVAKAAIANDEINSLGIRELIGRGVSYFRGSIANRVYNVGLGASRISGTLIAPGEEFSFNKTVGEISKNTGYKEAYVISSGRTVLDDGGGICQVSTTVFRAALDAGLPILKRTAHAYRVSYYEQGGVKPGLDATVWSPAVDFVFRNDSGHHILVQTIFNREAMMLEVDIYGTKDGRKVEISEPIISNQKPALPDRYEDDPSLPKGTIKQVDFAAAGATSVFSRKVTRGDEVLLDEKFTSYFRPWQAVYLRGTKE